MNLFKLSRWKRYSLAIIVIGSGIYLFSKFYVANALIFEQTRNQALFKDLQTTKRQLEVERSRTVVAEREADVVRRANTLLRESERQRQHEIASLDADLAFYRRLGGANGSQAALSVHHMELQATGSPRVFRIIFTLTQNIRWASAISGRIQLGLDGIQQGQARHLDDGQLLADSAEPLNFQFKYFQQLEGLITLPEGFEPIRLTVRLRSNSLRIPVEQSQQWQQLFDQPELALPGDEIAESATGD